VLSEETGSSFTVEVSVSLERVFVSGEGEHRKGDGDGEIDTDLSSFDVVLEVSGGRPGFGEYGGSVSVSVGVNEV